MLDNTKWIFITGGVLSGLGKGVLSASIAKLLQSKGYKIIPIKCDGYLNVDPGTMNPIEHGEVFVLEDGGEVDMDFGHYERFLGINGKFEWNLTSGKIFKEVIEKERKGEFLGETVQMIPHVTDEIKDNFSDIAAEENADIAIVEIGGTVGDIENMLFIESMRQMIDELPNNQTVSIHLTLVPFLESVGEQKTKPTQHSVKELEGMGINPQIVVGRSEGSLDDKTREKISLFCDVPKKNVVSDPKISNIYRLPLVLEGENVDKIIMEKLNLGEKKRNMEKWKELVRNMEEATEEVKIAICGKYTDLEDSYVSIEGALKHVKAHLSTKIDLEYIETSNIDKKEVQSKLVNYDGIIIPGGFGSRGAEGKIKVIEYARKNKIPLLGLCYGLQLMISEFARNVCGLEGANSTEVDEKTSHPVVDILPKQQDVKKMGGTMRLGKYTANLKKGSKEREIYGSEKVDERHRHRYEVNPEYHETLKDNGLKFSGTSKNGQLVEFIELDDHPFFIGTQAHPEFTSRLEDPNPLFLGFIRACKGIN